MTAGSPRVIGILGHQLPVQRFRFRAAGVGMILTLAVQCLAISPAALAASAKHANLVDLMTHAEAIVVG